MGFIGFAQSSSATLWAIGSAYLSSKSNLTPHPTDIPSAAQSEVPVRVRPGVRRDAGSCRCRLRCHLFVVEQTGLGEQEGAGADRCGYLRLGCRCGQPGISI